MAIFQTKLKFRIGEESLPILLKDEELDESPFKYTIRNAVRCLEYKIADSAQAKELKCTLIDHESDDHDFFLDWEYRTPNNIIAFLGDRGTGKTSCMRSMVSSCRKQHKEWMFTDEIDPSFFDEKHNILEILVGELYGKFRKASAEWDCLTHEKQDKLRNINSLFRSVKSAFRYFDKNELVDEYESETDCLKHLNDGGNLRQLLKKLIANLLDYYGKEMLVISIDDLDLNIQHSYVMMEQIRKYMILPRVAILIAARYVQLFDSICLVLERHYEKIQERVSHKAISEMAERYLTKMFPLDHRFDMPLPEHLLDSVLIVEDKDGTVIKDDGLSVADTIPAIIFDRTRFLFYNSVGMPSLVIPRNLRDLRMLVGMLYGMQPYDEMKDGVQNQRQFLSYFYQEWLETLDPAYRKFANALITEEDPAKINRVVVKNLYNFFLTDIVDLTADTASSGNIKDSYSREHKLIASILDSENSYWNVSVGDVAMLLNFVRKLNDSDKSQRLLFFIESFYSITLYRLYNKLTAFTTDQGLQQDNEQPSTSPRLKSTVHAEIPEYFRFVGGSFFSPTGDSFIPTPPSDSKRRERRPINGELLQAEIKTVVDSYGSLQEGADYPETLTARLRLCEFFMLTTKGKRTFRSSKNMWRLADEPLYFKNITTNTKNLIFDVTSPFFNAIYPKFCYDRFHDKIFGIAQKVPGSLLNQMILHNSREKQNNTWELMSKAAIRNMEILMDLTSWMLDKHDSLRPKGEGLIGSLKNFYQNFDIGSQNESGIATKGYFVKTYHRIADDRTSPYFRIDYSIFGLLAKVLENLNNAGAEGDSAENPRYCLNLFYAIMQEFLLFEDRPQYNTATVLQTLATYCRDIDIDALSKRFRSSVVISPDTLVRILSQIRLKHRYDFSGCIASQLKPIYEKQVANDAKSMKNDLKEQVHALSAEIEEIEAESESTHREIENTRQNLSDFQKDKDNNTVELQRLQDGKSEVELAIKELNDNKNLPDITDEERKNAENELVMAQNRLNAVSNLIKEHTRIIADRDSNIEESQNRLSDLQKQQRSLSIRKRNKTRKKRELEASASLLDNNILNPRPIVN